ncbi:hypothetical protein [Paenibacillus sp. MY03]|uniref:hypothetical protein n=1 Tax=Paenibacillus sp. MY03 TaxID=302980 RepID=UPI00117C4567|nr:hypothetical protein [Paenibacillus sp. MY03]
MEKIDFNNETIANRCRSLHDFGFKELKLRSVFTRVSFAIGGLINGATRKAEHKTSQENYDFTSEESKKQLITILKLKQEIEIYKELHGGSDLNK